MKSSPATANATPITSNGHAAPDESSGTIFPAPRPTANVVRPVRHQARYVRSFARRVRRVASCDSSKFGGRTVADSAGYGGSLRSAVERAGIEPATSGLQIPGFEPRLGQVRSVNAILRWLGEVEIGYSGTRFGTRFSRAFAP